jgi:hypothetical protein
MIHINIFRVICKFLVVFNLPKTSNVCDMSVKHYSTSLEFYNYTAFCFCGLFLISMHPFIFQQKINILKVYVILSEYILYSVKHRGGHVRPPSHTLDSIFQCNLMSNW